MYIYRGVGIYQMKHPSYKFGSMKYTLVCVYAPSEKTKYSFQFLLTEKNSQYLIAISHWLPISYLTN